MQADSNRPRYNSVEIFRRLCGEVRPFWRHTSGLFVLNSLSTPLALLTPLPLKIAVDSVIGSRPIPQFLEVLLPGQITVTDRISLILAVGLTVIIALLSQFQGLASSLLRTYTGEKMVLNFRTQLFRHLQRLSLSYHDTKGITDSTYRVQYDAPSIQWITIDGLIPFLISALTVFGMIFVTARIDYQLAMVALAVSPVLFIAARVYGPRLRSQWREVKRLESSAFSVVHEVLAAVRVVRAFGQEDREQERFTRHANEGVGARLRVAVSEGGFSLLIGLTIAVGTAAFLYIGVRRVQTGMLTLGDLLLVMSYLAQLYAPLQTISKSLAALQSSLAGADRVFSLLDESPDVVEPKNPKPLSRAGGSVAFRNVSFAYDKDQPVLHEISFKVNPGSKLGIMGMTGAGKTTLVSLLTRFYDPTTGQILLDGVDLRDYRLADLRNQFAIVLQEPVLFSTTIAENIAYARPEASEEEIMEAAKAANAHEFIVGLPDGYNAVVGERGMRLSGGERQRIALARAFLKDAPVLILDEPTSAVDVKTEAEIMEAMRRLMEGRTTFIIAHRLSTLKNCDLLLTIESGRLVTVTSHMATAVGTESLSRQRGAARTSRAVGLRE